MRNRCPLHQLRPQEQPRRNPAFASLWVTLIIGIAGICAPEPIRRYNDVLEHKLLALFFLIFVVLALTVVWSLGAGWMTWS